MPEKSVARMRLLVNEVDRFFLLTMKGPCVAVISRIQIIAESNISAGNDARQLNSPDTWLAFYNGFSVHMVCRNALIIRAR